MLVCHCNVITDKEITRIVRDFLADDPWTIIVPAKVYKALDKRCKCSGCVPNVVDLITGVTAEYHREIAEATAGADAGAGVNDDASAAVTQAQAGADRGFRVDVRAAPAQ